LARGQTGEDWVSKEFGGVDLGDARLSRRLVELAQNLARNPECSLPRAMPDKASLKAAYRFFDNDGVEAQQLLASHLQETRARAGCYGTVLAIQDTSGLDYRTHYAAEGLGPTTADGGHGLLMHNTLIATPERLPLGVIYQRAWARERGKGGIRHQRRARSIQDKESRKWLHGLQASCQFAKDTGRRVVCVADREADVYDLFAAERPANVELLIRAAWNRRVHSAQQQLWPTLAASPALGRATVHLPRQGTTRRARTCELRVHACEVKLRPPKWRSAHNLKPVAIHALWAVETPAPKTGAIEWMLLSTMPISNLTQALELLDWYCARWTIEVWHKVLKSGCRIEALQLASADRLTRALAVYSVLAWRLLYATMLSRTSPEIPASVLLRPEEWQALYCAVHHTAKPCAEPPTLQQAVHWIARLGGFIGRKSDGEPGPKTIWYGFQALNQLTQMFLTMRPPPLGS
jgi:hypothetical protein